MKKRPIHRLKPLALAIVVAFNPGYVTAQVVPVNGAGVKSALNGVPVVDIVAPNASGVSHNRYAQFNVEARGLILNNAGSAVVTRLGGGVAGNANLAGGGARLILNEVVQPNRSLLNGFIEVGGAAADVVLANPAGITCNGCGFINTPRATLTTGTPNLDIDGGLTGFSVRQGDIAVTGTGLDGTGQTAFDLLARVVSLGGQVNARSLVVAGGAHDFNYATRAVTAAAGAGAAPAFGIDSSALGGMYVDRVRLIATEAGVGVRLLGEVGASADDVTLTASGQIQLRGRLTAVRDVGISGGSVLADGATVAAGGNLSVASAASLVLAGGILGAEGNAAFTAGSLDDNGGAGALRFADGTLSLNVTGAAAIDAAQWNGGSSLGISAGSLQASGASFSSSTGDTLATPSGAVSIVTGGLLDLGDSQAASGTTMLLRSTGGAVSLGGSMRAAGALQVLAATNLTNSGTVEGDAGMQLSATGTFTNAGEVAAAGTLAVTAGTLTNAGRIESVDDLAIAAQGTLTNSGALLAGNDLVIGLRTPATDSLVVENTGHVEAGGALAILGRAGATRALTINNRAAAILSGGTLDFRADFLDNAGVVYAEGTGAIDASRILNRNAAASITFEGAGMSTILAAGAQGVENNGLVYAGGGLTVTAGRFRNMATGATYAENDLAVTSAGELYNLGFLGAGNASGALTLQGTDVTNDQILGGAAGEIYAQGTLSIAGTTRVRNYGYIDAMGNTVVTTPVFLNEALAPATEVDEELHVVPGTKTPLAYNYNQAAQLLPSSEFWLNNQNIDHQQQRGSIRPAGVRIRMVTGGVPYNAASGQPTDCYNLLMCPDFYRLEWQSNGSYWEPLDDPNPREVPQDANWTMFRNWTGQAYTGLKYASDPTLTQARLATAGNLTVNSTNITNRGARLESAGNMTLNGAGGAFVNGDLTLQQTVYQVLGREKWDTWQYDPSVLPLDGHILIDEMDAVVISNPAGAQLNVAMLGGTVRAGGTFSAPGMSITNGSVPIRQSQNNFVVNTPSAPGGVAATPGGVSAPGLSLTLPVNPNGLFVPNLAPGARYLIETNPRFTSLESPEFGSDYLVERLGLEPDRVMQRLGDPRYEQRLVSQQLAAQAGIDTLKAVGSMDDRMKALMDNAVWAAGKLELSLGIALTPEQQNALKQDIVWMVETTVQGRRVLAPVVYLASASRAQVTESKVIADRIVVSDAQTFVNTGTVHGTTEVSIRTSGDILNVGGTIAGGNVGLTSTDGNVLNRTVVNRSGDDANHRDFAGRTATIAASGDLAVEATKGSITSVGGDLNAGRDASLSAGGDVTLRNIVTETKTTVERSYSTLISSSTERTITVDQESRGSTLQAGRNLTIDAQRDVTLEGSQAAARGDVNVDARSINITNATTTDSRYSYSSSRGMESGTYRDESTETNRVQTNVEASGLRAGSNLSLTGRESVTVQGSDVAAGNNLAVTTARLETRAAQQTTEVTTRSSSLVIGPTGSADGNKTEGGISGSRTESSGNASSSIARTSTLRSGGDMSLDAQGGSLVHEGTQIGSEGSFSQRANTIEMRAAQNSFSAEEQSRTTGGGVTAGAYYNVMRAGDQASEGSVPGVGLPSAMIGVTGSESNSSASRSGTQAVTTNITSRGSVTSESTARTLIEGSQIQANSSVTLRAGELDFRAAQDTASTSSRSDSRSGGAQGGIDAMGKPTGGAQGAYSDGHQSSSSTTAVTGSIVSNTGTTIVTTGDAKFEGTNLRSGGATSIEAGGSVQLNAATNTAQSSSASRSFAGAAGQDSSGTGDNKQASGSFQVSDGSSSSSTAVVGSITSQGGVTVSAGRQGDVVMQGTNVRSERGDVAISAGRDVRLEVARSTASASSESYGGNLAVAPGDKKEGGGSFDAAGNYANQSSSSTVETGGSLSGRNVSINAGRDTLLHGTEVAARDRASVNTGGSLTMQSAQSTSTSSGAQYGGEAGAAQGTKRGGDESQAAGGGHVGFNVGTSSADSVVNRNAQVSGASVSINTGGDMTMQGANVSGGQVGVNVGGNLVIESRVDSSSASSTQVGGYVGGQTGFDRDASGKRAQYGGDLRTGVSGNLGLQSSESSRVTQQSGITGGDTTVNVLTGTTTLQGGLITGERSELNTRSLTQSDLQVGSSSSSLQGGGGLSANTQQVPGGSRSSDSSSGTVRSVVGGGDRVQATLDVAQMSRVLSQPAVQTALQLNKSMKSAAALHGGADNVPADTLRKVLDGAGVGVPANADAVALRTLLNNALDAGYSAAQAQLAQTGIAPSQAGSILKAIVP
jgi:filamentous hemagglutinin